MNRRLALVIGLALLSAGCTADVLGRLRGFDVLQIIQSGPVVEAVSKAKNKKEFLEALKGWKVPALNIVYADVDGHIGWVAAGLTPVRKGWEV